MNGSYVGQALERRDAAPKVRGAATYAAEHQIPGVVYAVPVSATIAKGRVVAIDTRAAAQNAGVLAILTHENAPRLQPTKGAGSIGEDRLPLQDDAVHYDGQHVAMVIADTFERAVEAAMKVKVTYQAEPAVIALERNLSSGFKPEAYINGKKLQISRGNPAAAPVTLEQTYSTPVEHHNPMEPHATIATWNGDELTLYETTQGVMNMRAVVAKAFALPGEKVHVVSPYVGGGFGSKGFLWPHTIMAAMAARTVGRPVKLVLSRQQMFSSNGHRGRTVQRIALGAETDGKLQLLRHATSTETSEVSQFMEPCGLASAMLYACPNVEITHAVARVNTGSPTPTRGPGEAPGPFALESAMDELAYQLKMDPIELRIRNHADSDPETGKPWSSKHLLECYRRGAAAFGWSRRDPRPRSMRDGRYLVGLGMATACYPAVRRPAAARLQLQSNGQLVVSSATQDIGTGTYTILAQIVADEMGLPIDAVRCEIGDSALPPAQVSGGSSTAASVGSAVRAAAQTLRAKLTEMAMKDPASPLHRAPEDAITYAEGRLIRRDNPAVSDRYGAIMARATEAVIEARVDLDPTGSDAAKQHPAVTDVGEHDKPEEPFSWYSFGAQFAEVRVDPLLAEVRVRRIVSVHDIGRVLNAKTARSQIHGGVVWGIGMALMEHTVYDERDARLVTRNLADYLVPVNPDVPDIEVLFIDEPDPHFNALGARGVGEIGITGVAAAVANAVYHATGRRIRNLPITPETLL